MRRLFLILIFLFLIIFVSKNIFAAQSIKKIKVSYPATSMSILGVVIADKKGFFEEQGLKVQLLMMRANLAISALVSGEVDYTTAYGSTVRGAARGLPIKAVMILSDRPMHYLITRKEYNSVKELKGKVAGVNSMAGTEAVVTKEIFKYFGIDPKKDITLIVAGDTLIRLQSLISGIIDAATVPLPGPVVAKRMGLKLLVSAAEIMELPLAGIGTTDRKIKENPDEVKKLISSALKGLQFIRTNREETIKIIIDWIKLDREAAELSYDLALKSYSRDGSISRKAILLDLSIAREEGQFKEEIPISNVADFTLLEEVKKTIHLK